MSTLCFISVTFEPHRGIRGKCSRCRRPAPGYDRLPERPWLLVPLWGITTRFLCAPRRVHCPVHGVVVEHLPWGEGKRPVTLAIMSFLARGARRLSWRETARAFQTRWECVDRSVQWQVRWGLAHRPLTGVQSIGVDEIHRGKGKRADNFLTVLDQLDTHCRRLLWVGRRRTQATLRRGLAALGPTVVSGLRFACSDLWQPYLSVLAANAGHVIHVLDRFHITRQLNEALDNVRRAESGRLRAEGRRQARHLKHLRWKLLRRFSRVRGRAKEQLRRLLRTKLVTARAWALKDLFEHFWTYKSVRHAGAFLEFWTWRALRRRIEPMERLGRTLRGHQELILNWFRAKGEISSGAVEGLNNKLRVVTRRAYGFRTYEAMELALYHTLGKLPEPDELAHGFC